jgi:hypothetical protein
MQNDEIEKQIIKKLRKKKPSPPRLTRPTHNLRHETKIKKKIRLPKESPTKNDQS